MGKLILAVYVIANAGSPEGQFDPRMEPEYDQCMQTTIQEFGYYSQEWLEMDGLCAAVIALSARGEMV